MSKGRIIAGVVVLVVIAAVVGGVFYSSAASAPLVTTATAAKETLGVIVTASGKVEAASRADVFAPVPGTLSTVEVKDGDAVRAGQTLAVMDKEPLRLQVRQAAAALKGAKAQLDAIKRGVPSAIDKAAAKAGVTAASASYDSVHASYEAFLALFNASTPSVQASMEATLTQLSIADKQAAAALASARSGQSKLTAASKVSAAKASAESGVDAASAALALAENNLDAATLTAPMDGVVVFNATGAPGTDGALPKASPGTAVAPGAAIFTVIDMNSLNFNAQVDEADIDKVEAGMKAKVTLDAFAATTFTGTVATIRKTAVQTTTGGIAFPVLISVDEAGKKLLVGMSGSADIEVNAVSGALTVPIESILDDNGKKFVFVVTDNKVAKVQVTTGALTDTSAQVLTGLKDGDVVATSQLTTLTDGMAVRVQ